MLLYLAYVSECNGRSVGSLRSCFEENKKEKTLDQSVFIRAMRLLTRSHVKILRSSTDHGQGSLLLEGIKK